MSCTSFLAMGRWVVIIILGSPLIWKSFETQFGFIWEEKRRGEREREREREREEKRLLKRARIYIMNKRAVTIMAKAEKSSRLITIPYIPGKSG